MIFIVVINAQLEQKRKLALELSAERQKLEIMKKNEALMEEDIVRRRIYSRKIFRVNTNPQILLICRYFILILIVIVFNLD